jgi:hypothetical protein
VEKFLVKSGEIYVYDIGSGSCSGSPSFMPCGSSSSLALSESSVLIGAASVKAGASLSSSLSGGVGTSPPLKRKQNLVKINQITSI